MRDLRLAQQKISNQPLSINAVGQCLADLDVVHRRARPLVDRHVRDVERRPLDHLETRVTGQAADVRGGARSKALISPVFSASKRAWLSEIGRMMILSSLGFVPQ